MKKSILFIVIISIISSCSLQKLRPTPQSSKSLKVLGGGFIIPKYGVTSENNIKDVRYTITLEALNLENIINKYVIVEFQDPENLKTFITNIKYIDNKNNKVISFKSEPIFKLKYYKTYLVRISLSNDKYGKEIIENINQYIISYMPPYGFTNFRTK